MAALRTQVVQLVTVGQFLSVVGLTLFLFASTFIEEAQANDVLVLTSQDTGNTFELADSVQALQGTGVLGTVSGYNTLSQTPTLNDLSPYDSVAVWSNLEFADPVQLGNVLADYVDQGGAVVLMNAAGMHDNSQANWGIQGRFVNQGYLPVVQNGSIFFEENLSLGTVYNSLHPIMQNVSSVGVDNILWSGAVAANGTVIADWSIGYPLVVDHGSHPVVYVNVFFYSDTYSATWGYDSNSDVPLLVANALNYVRNTPPTVDDVTVTMSWNTTHTFSLSEFEAQFSDPDPGDQLEELRIVTLPSDGTLEYQNNTISTGQLPFDIDRADIGDLVYIPDSNFSGTDSFEYNASDGTAFANDAADVNINVNFVNTPPTIDDVNITAPQNGSYTFSLSEFEAQFSDPDPGHQLEALRILSLPSDGTLEFQGNTFTVPHDVDRNEIGDLVYYPDSSYLGPDQFEYNASDGIDWANDTADVLIDVQWVNTPPTINSFPVSLNENSSYDFTLAEFENEFSDPDPGHQLEELRIVTLPVNGELEWQGNAIEAGQLPFDINRNGINALVYVPDPYFNGSDSFEYNASDGIDWANGTADVMITVDPYNNAPVLDNSGDPYLNSAFIGVISPQGTSVPTLLSRGAGGDPISDPDVIDPRGIAIIAADEAHGNWEFTLDGGQSWQGFSNLSDDNALLLGDSQDVQIRFNSTSFTGTIDPAIEYRAWDQYEGSNGDFYDIPANGGTGGMNAFSDDTETAYLEVHLPPEVAIEREGTPIADGASDHLGTVAPLARQRLTYTVRNIGAGPLRLTGTPRVEVAGEVNATAYLIVVPNENISTNSQTTFMIHLTPQATGAFEAQITVPNDDPDRFDYSFTIEGQAGNLASIAVEHEASFLVENTQLDLGRVSTERMQTLEFTIHNRGAADLGELSVAFEGRSNITAEIDPYIGQASLAPGESTGFGVNLRPLSSGRAELLIRISSDDPTSPAFDIPVTGQATTSGNPRLAIERLPGAALPRPDATDEVDYLLAGSPTALTWTLRNIGASSLSNVAATVVDETNAIVTITGSPAATIPAGEASNVTVDVQPLASDPFSFTLIVESNDGGAPTREIEVIGEGTNTVQPRLVMFGTEPEAVANGESTTIPPYWPGMDSAYPFVIANQGTAPLEVSIPVQLGAQANCLVDIVQQPSEGPTMTIQPQGFAVVHTSMQPVDPTSGTSFDVIVTSNDPANPVYTITATSEGPVGGVPDSEGRGCAVGAGFAGSAAMVQGLLLLLLLTGCAALRRKQFRAC